jgi:uncharacterized UPF0160 family protein
MKYILNRKDADLKIIEFPDEIEGLEISPQTKSEESAIKIKSMTLVDKKFIKSYINQKLDKRFEKIINILNKSLVDDSDDTDEGAKQALGEIQKMKSMIINKYKIYLTEKQYKDFLSKIILMEEEFKVRYNQKIAYRQMNYVNEENKNRSR